AADGISSKDPMQQLGCEKFSARCKLPPFLRPYRHPSAAAAGSELGSGDRQQAASSQEGACHEPNCLGLPKAFAGHTARPGQSKLVRRLVWAGRPTEGRILWTRVPRRKSGAACRRSVWCEGVAGQRLRPPTRTLAACAGCLDGEWGRQRG